MKMLLSQEIPDESVFGFFYWGLLTGWHVVCGAMSKLYKFILYSKLRCKGLVALLINLSTMSRLGIEGAVPAFVTEIPAVAQP